MSAKSIRQPDLGVVVVAGGGGQRFGGDKLLANLGGIPVFLHCLRSFAPLCPPGSMVVATPPGRAADFAATLRTHLPWLAARVVEGGKTRSESALRGLEALPAATMVAAIHDAARPLASANLLERCVESARSCGSGVAGRPLSDTIKQCDPRGMIIATPPRDGLWTVETPQVFRKDDILAAYRQVLSSGAAVTDDAGALELAGGRVFLVDNHEPNLKITYPADLPLAAALLGGFRP